MRLDPDVAQELYEAAGQVRTRGVTAGEQRLVRALNAAQANDEANRRASAGERPWPPALDAEDLAEPPLAQARRHLQWAATVMRDDSYDLDAEEYDADAVAAANVHARLGHALTAVAMLARAEQPAEDAPGLAALEKLAAAVERLAGDARPLDVVFDGPPAAVAGRFVEVEDTDGRSVKAGEWIDRGDGKWALRLHVVQTEYRRG